MNIKYITDLKTQDYLEMLKLWNDEMGKIYPINPGSFDYNVIDYKDKRGMKAIDENGKIVGFVILKEFHDDYLTSYEDCLFVHLFYVGKKYRRNGIGSKFVEYIKEEGKNGNKNIWIGKEIGNFAPGIPCEFDNLTDNFLEKRGFTCGKYTHDLINRNPKKMEITNPNVKYEICAKDKENELVEFIERNGWKRWAYEAIQEFKNDENNKCYIIGILDGNVISFAKVNTLTDGRNSYNMMWKDRFDSLGGIGPLGVDKEYRKMHLGGDIIKAAQNYLVDYGVSDIIIDWTGLMELYQKYGFEVYKSFKYTYLKNE